MATYDSSERLWAEIVTALESEGFRLSLGAEAELRGLVAEAARRMEAEGRTEPDDVSLAVRATLALIVSASQWEQRGVRPFRRRREVEPKALLAALRGLCPGFWPFC